MLTLAVALAWCGRATALDCPPPFRQATTDWQVEWGLKLAQLGKFGGAEGSGRVAQVTRDLVGKWPNDADPIRYMVFASACSGLRDDNSLSEAEKASKLHEYGLALITAQPPSSGAAQMPTGMAPLPSKAKTTKGGGATVKMDRTKPAGAVVALESSGADKVVVAIRADGSMAAN